MAIATRNLKSGLGNEGSGAPLVHEIFTQINNAKDKPKKIEVLKKYDNPAIRQLLKAAFDPKIEWDLPEGTYESRPCPQTSHNWQEHEC